MHAKILSAKWRPFCLGLNVLSSGICMICRPNWEWWEHAIYPPTTSIHSFLFHKHFFKIFQLYLFKIFESHSYLTGSKDFDDSEKWGNPLVENPHPWSQTEECTIQIVIMDSDCNASVSTWDMQLTCFLLVMGKPTGLHTSNTFISWTSHIG